MKTVLTIAGSDSGGGAGIQADLKTMQAHGVYGLTALTAVTAQNTVGVHQVFPLPAYIVAAQIQAVFDDFQVDAVKIGMLPDAGVAAQVSRSLQACARGVPLVLDTILSSTTGQTLAAEDAARVMLDELFPLAYLVTPNLDEASKLSGVGIRSRTDINLVAEVLRGYGARNVLIKGGHILPDGDSGGATDVLMTEDGTVREFTAPRIITRHTHGTGCTLASAIACALASGQNLIQAIEQARDYVRNAIIHAPGLGHGYGPLQHN